MKVLTIIGNGFDLGHELPTRFDDFIFSDYEYLSDKYTLFNNGENTWREVEEIYGEQLIETIQNRSWHDVTEVVENVVQDYGLNQYGEVDYYNFSSDAFDEEFNRIEDYIRLLSEFEIDFQGYLRKHCGNQQLRLIAPRETIGEILDMSTRVISFNYTETIETVYGVGFVEHIHGKLSDRIAIGSGTLDFAKESLVDDKYPTIEKFGKDKHGLQEMMFYYDYDDEGNRYENQFIKRFFDEVVVATNEREESLFDLLNVKSKDALKTRIDVIESLKREAYDKVYIIGHSLGEADYSVFDAINKNAIITYFYHSPKDLPRIQKTFTELGFRYKLVLDDVLFN